MATAADFTIEEFAAWVRTKPADEEYFVCLANVCALGQFGTETGREYLHTCYDPQKELGLPKGFNRALGFGLRGADTTFGALAERLEALLPVEPSDIWTRAETYLSADVGEYAE